MAQPRFEFRLEALLEHRRRLEKDEQRKVAVIQQEAAALVRQIQDAQAQIVAQNRTLATEKLVGVLDLQYIAHEKRFVGNLHLRVLLTMQKLAGVEKKLAAARAELLKAARARKVIEKLREKQFQRWLAELERKDAAAMDEIGTQLAIREMEAAEAAG
jgi:flagellar FliJ protein